MEGERKERGEGGGEKQECQNSFLLLSGTERIQFTHTTG